jgi:hypothetical protein
MSPLVVKWGNPVPATLNFTIKKELQLSLLKLTLNSGYWFVFSACSTLLSTQLLPVHTYGLHYSSLWHLTQYDFKLRYSFHIYSSEIYIYVYVRSSLHTHTHTHTHCNGLSHSQNSLVFPLTPRRTGLERKVEWPPKDSVKSLVERIYSEVESLSYKV